MDEQIRLAATNISEGRVILYPTDTIWGIGCDATLRKAVERIYRIKNRSDSKSMLVLMDDPAMLYDYLDHVPEKALEIISESERPTTIIYPGARGFASNLVAKDGTIGIRVTRDPFCKSLIQSTGKPIVSTSANVSGEPSPSLFREISPGILESVDHVVEWRQDETESSSPSTIIRINPFGDPEILRA